MPMQGSHDGHLRTGPGNAPRNPYLIKNDGRSVVFRTPFVQTLVYLIPGLLWWTIYVFFAWNLGMKAYEVWFIDRGDVARFAQSLVVFSLLTSPFLWIGGICILASGRSSIAFDLQQRTYRQITLAPPPVFGKRQPDTTGWGNPLIRRIRNGLMSDLEGVQIVEREDKRQRIYSVYVVPKDIGVFPCVVYYGTGLEDAQTQMQEIAFLLDLPTLKTSLMDDPNSLLMDTPGTVRAHDKNNTPLVPSPPLLKNGFCTTCTSEIMSFATAKKYRILQSVMIVSFLCIAAATFSLAVYCTIHPDPKVNPIEVYGMTAFWLLPATASVINTGMNRITLDLVHRTYERTFFGPPLLGAPITSIVPGNRFRQTSVSGTMDEIAGVQILARTGGKNNTKFYGLQLQWKNDSQRAMGVGVFLDRRQAQEQATNIANILSLPLLGIDEKKSHRVF